MLKHTDFIKILLAQIKTIYKKSKKKFRNSMKTFKKFKESTREGEFLSLEVDLSPELLESSLPRSLLFL